jgi:hypothetical protein
VIITGTALALTNSRGIIDLLTNRREGVEILPDAYSIVQHNVPQSITNDASSGAFNTDGTDTPQIGAESDLVAFSVREAVYDGKNIYITVEARPSNPDYLLLAQYYQPSDVVINLGNQFAGMEGSVADYADEHNKTMIRSWAGIKGIDQEISDIFEPDGTQLYIISGAYETGADKLEVELSCGADRWLEVDGEFQIDMAETQRYTLSVTLDNTGAKEIKASATTAVYANCGVRVNKVTLSGSAMSIYVEIDYTVIDAEKFAAIDGDLGFEFLDEDGERLPGGADSGWKREAYDENGAHIIPKWTISAGMRIVQTSSIRAMDTLPDEIILRGYSQWNGEYTMFETFKFEMK